MDTGEKMARGENCALNANSEQSLDKRSKRRNIKHQVRTALEAGQALTSLDAYYRFGSHHLASTISTLRSEGMAITSTRVTKRYPDRKAVAFALYHLAGVQPEADGRQ